MKVPEDFSSRMTALAEGIPRQVLAGLLTRLMPAEPVTTRAPSGETPPPPPEAARQPIPIPSGTKKRRSKAMTMRLRIVPTFKGSRKARSLPLEDNLNVILGSATVRDAVRRGLAYSDVTYAERVGYITLEGE